MAVFDLEAVIKLTDEGFKQGLSKAGQAVSTFAKVTGAAFAAGGAAIGALTTKSVKAYADFEQLSGGVQKLFGGSADQMMQYAQQAYQTAGMSANQYMEQATSFAAALIQSYEGDTERAAAQADKAMRAISDNFNTFGGDIQAVQSAFQGFAKQNYSMLDNLKLGYGGTKTEMERLIADANEYAEAMGKAGDLSIENFGDVVEAIELIQEKQNIAGTTAREASTTISGSLMATKAAWENLLVAFSNPDADLGTYFNALTDSATTAFGNIVPVAEQALSGIGTVIEGIAPMIGTTLPGVISSVLPSLLGAINGLVTSIAEALPGMIDIIIDAVIAAIPLLIESGIKLFTGLATGLIKAIPKIVAALPRIWQSVKSGVQAALPDMQAAGQMLMEMIGNGISAAGNFVLDAAHSVWTELLGGSEESWQGMVDSASSAWENIASTLPAAWEGIQSAASAAGEGLRSFWAENGSAIMDDLSMIWNEIMATLSSVWDSIVSIAEGIWTGLQNFWMTWGDSIMTAFSSIWDTIKTLFSAAMDAIKAAFAVFAAAFQGDWAGAWEAVKALASTIWNGIKSVLTSIWNGVKAVASSVWGAIGSNIISLWNGVKAAASSVWNGIKSAITSAWDAVASAASSVWNAISSTISSVWASIKAGVSTAVNAVSTTISSVFSSISSTVSSIWNGISSTISSVWDGIKTTVSNAVEKVKSFLNFEWSLPHIKLPHFSITGEFSLSPPSVPWFTVSWYKKAMQVPYMLSDATIFGAGEAGDEMIYGRQALMEDIKEASSGSNAALEAKMDMIISVLADYLPELASRPVLLDGDALVGALGNPMDQQLGEINTWRGRGLSMA